MNTKALLYSLFYLATLAICVQSFSNYYKIAEMSLPDQIVPDVLDSFHPTDVKLHVGF